MLRNIAATIIITLLPMSLIAQENQVKIVALVLSMSDYSPSSDNILRSLEALNAQTLQVESPNASELRSVLKRFAAAALDNDIALVFADGPILKLGARDFLAPAGIDLRRGSDLLTQAIPVSAFARATALANAGGAIFLHSSDLGKSLPDGVTLSQTAPEARPGTSPIIFGQSGSAMDMAFVIDANFRANDVDLTQILLELVTRVEFSASYIPNQPVILLETVMAQPAGIPETSETGESNITGDGTIESDTADDTSAQSDVQSNGRAGLNLPQIQAAESVEDSGETIPESGTADDTTDDTAAAEVLEEKPLSIEMLQALESGLTRTEKRTIQHALRDLRFYAGLIDGIFGRQTAFAIEEYQKSIGAEVTGVLSVQQLADLSN